jgi:hypothetical protein
MEFLGNIFTHYNYTTTDIKQTTEGTLKKIYSEKSKFNLVIEKTESEINIPFNSPFLDWKDARKFAGPLPHTFTYDPKDKTVLIIEGVRQNWRPEPVNVKSYKFDFLNSLNLQGVVLANAFQIKNIPYYWKKGQIEKWN